MKMGDYLNEDTWTHVKRNKHNKNNNMNVLPVDDMTHKVRTCSSVLETCAMDVLRLTRGEGDVQRGKLFFLRRNNLIPSFQHIIF